MLPAPPPHGVDLNSGSGSAASFVQHHGLRTGKTLDLNSSGFYRE